MTADHNAAIAAAEATLAAAQADVDRLRAQLASEQVAEQAAEPAPRKLATAADGVAAARKRHPGRTRSEQAASTDTRTDAATFDGDAPDPYTPRTPQAAYTERYGIDPTSIEGAKAEARRRGAARRPRGGAA